MRDRRDDEISILRALIADAYEEDCGLTCWNYDGEPEGGFPSQTGDEYVVERFGTPATGAHEAIAGRTANLHRIADTLDTLVTAAESIASAVNGIMYDDDGRPR